MKKLLIAACCMASLLTGTPVGAQESWPQKPIRLIVPFAPGGASDFTARIISQSLSEELKQSIIVENKGGAAGNIGMDAAAKSAPDGYTLFLGNVGATSINPSIFGAALRVKPEADVPDVLVVNPSVPVSTVADFITYAVASKGALNFGSPGSGSQNRLEMEFLMKEAKFNMVHVPYKGGAGPAMTDLIGGHTQVMFTTMPSAMAFIKSGRVRALGVTSEARLPELPGVPTLVEQGFPTMVSSSWQGIFVPRGTPAPVVQRIFSAMTKVMALKVVKDKLAPGGVIASTSTSPEAFAAFVASETVRWGKVVREGNITAE
jgi:tripartite-type tricarboxylate transporter receptor subunit TctC